MQNYFFCTREKLTDGGGENYRVHIQNQSSNLARTLFGSADSPPSPSALRLTKNPPWYFLHGLAWILAAHPDPRVRDAGEAIQLAKQAQSLTFTTPDDIRVLDTLAAAYAANGRFELAVSNVQKALALASPNSQDEITKQIRQRLKLYKQGKPYTLDISKPKTELAPDTDKTNKEHER